MSGKKKVVRKTASSTRKTRRSPTRKTKKPSPTRKTKGSSRRVSRPAKTKTRRFKSGTVSLRQIRKQQKSVDHILDRDPFKRYIKANLNRLVSGKNVRMNVKAIEILQEATERYLVDLYSKANDIAIHSGRKGITGNDVELVVRIRQIL